MVTISLRWPTAMSNVIILYWQPGSCGDFVQSTLLSNPNEYAGVVKKFNTSTLGRTIPSLDLFFAINFEHSPGQWYHRTWTHSDCKQLYEYSKTLPNDNLLVPTHRIDQLKVLQRNIPNSKTMGIIYPNNMFPLVLKNWCKKVAADDKLINSIYTQPIHKLMREKNSFGEFVLLEQLRHGTKILPEVCDIFDISISLEELFCGHTLENFTWLATQNQLHQYQCNLHPVLKNALGFNAMATRINHSDLHLDVFDNILIKHYCLQHTTIKNIPIFNLVSEATCYFNKLEIHDNY